jgi:cytochrome b subunit of formate dehydrogenase
MSATVERHDGSEIGPETQSPETKVVVRRFSMWTRATHAVLAASVFGLVLTGMPMRYQDAFWAHWLFALEHGHDGAAALHKTFAVGFFAAGAMHVAGLLAAWFTGRFRLRSILEPDSILLRPQDLKNIVANLRFLHDRGPRPPFARFTYWEKFDYFAEIWGLLVIGLSGLAMWFPARAAEFLPGWVVNAALIFHSYEGLLAMGFLFSIHFFNTHLRPDVFPVDPVIFSGEIPLDEVEERYPGWFERLVQRGEGRLSRDHGASRSAYFISVAYLTVGLFTLLFVMIAALVETWRYFNAVF